MLECHCRCVCCDVQVFLLPGDDLQQLNERPLTCLGCGRRLQPTRVATFGEAEWLACTDPVLLVQLLGRQSTDRKRRLFACACCRHVWDLLTDRRSREAVELAERFADGQATGDELQRAYSAAQSICTSAPGDSWVHVSWLAELASGQRLDLRSVVRRTAQARWRQRSEEEASITALFRDVIVNPFRPVSLDPAWLTWDHGTVAKLALAIYQERAFDRLPILADALEDAGCGNADLLNHCRQPGKHVRGCWALDLLLGKS